MVAQVLNRERTAEPLPPEQDELQQDQQRQQRFRRDFERFAALSDAAGRPLPVKWDDRQPCLQDGTITCGFDRHYVYHTAWAARVLAANRPARHVDISSSLYFCSIVSAFLPVDYYEYRPANLRLDNLAVNTADLLRLPWADGSVRSLSCMHVVEHIGLGRYGDPLDATGDVKAMNELARVVAPGGTLLLVCPVGRPRVVFNAHRINSVEQILGYFPDFVQAEFALIPDGRTGLGLLRDASPTFANEQWYGCGCFHLTKR
jgi:SAM-dependent methyltransferase